MAVAIVELPATLTPTGVAGCATEALLFGVGLLGFALGILLYLVFIAIRVLKALDRR